MRTTARHQVAFLLLLALMIPVLAACGSAATSGSTTAVPATAMAEQPTAMAEQPTAMAEQPTTGSSSGAAGSWKPRNVTVTLTGSGASFPDPIYQKWIQDYKAIAPGVTINYQSVGS